MEKKMNVPGLRFPEFEGEWVEKKLGEIAEIKTGNKDTQNKVDDGIYPFFVRSNIVERINSYSYNGEAILTSGDGVGVGKNFHYINGKFDFHQRVYCLRNFKNDYSGRFIYYIFSNKFYGRVIRLSAKNSVDSVRMDMISDMNIYFPIIFEQTKIASFLTAVDDKLTQLKKKKSLLDKYKKGVMQKIFSQELRFKDDNGEDFPEWEEKRLGELYTYISTNSLTRDDLNYEEGTVKNIHYGDIHKKFQSHFNIVNEIVPFINNEASLKRIADDNYCKEGDLIIADASEDYLDIGKTIEIINLNKEKVVAGLHTIHARPILEYLAIGFGGHLMKSENIRLQIKTISQGTKVLSITSGRLSNTILKLPSLPEQTKIAIFLSAIDEKINHCSKQIARMEEWKKGLLQQMFC